MLTLSLPPEIEQYLRQAVATGEYGDEQAVVLEAIRLLRDRDARHRQLRADIEEAIQSVDRGEGTELESPEATQKFFDELEAEVQAELAEKKGTA
jgi:putative addiction module CopG family antidote